MKNKLNLSIIIPTMNRYKTLTDTLESIYVGEIFTKSSYNSRSKVIKKYMIIN